jgi:hypothetical protein
MKTTEPTIGKHPLTGWSSRLPTATLDLRGRHEKPTLAQKVEAIRQAQDAELEAFAAAWERNVPVFTPEMAARVLTNGAKVG